MRSTAAALAAGAMALSLAALAGGCGGTGNAASGASNASASRDDAQLEFARCMRDHGVDVEDPKPGRRGGIAIRGRPGDEKKLEAAQKACQKLVPGGFKEPTPEERERFRDAALKFARCMRAHGIDVPDPSTNGGGILMTVPRQQNRSKFEAAQKTCQKLMPGPGPSVSMEGGS